MVEVHAATSLRHSLELGRKRGARSWLAVHRGLAERCSSRRIVAQHTVCSSVRRLGPLGGIVAPLPARSRVGKYRRCESSEPAGPRRASELRRLRVELSSPTSLRGQRFRRLCFGPGRRGEAKPNERMQLTWLPGAPSRSASVHRRVVGRRGLGSAATQLMRAVRCSLRVQLAHPSPWILGRAEIDS